MTGATTSWTSVSLHRPAVWPLRALVIGDLASEEFRDCLAQIRETTDAVEITDAEQAVVAAARELPDLIIIAAERPGGLSDRLVEAMRQAAPLARIVGLLGSWCEGESRTGRPWPAVTRVYAHSWAAWFEREVTVLADGRCGTLSLPLTATDEERLLATNHSAQARRDITVGIHASGREADAMLHDVCLSLGHRPVPLDQVARASSSRPRIGIWDTAVLDDRESAELRAAVERTPGVRWIVILDFPRREDIEQALACGAAAVVARPFFVDDLAAAIARLAEATF